MNPQHPADYYTERAAEIADDQARAREYAGRELRPPRVRAIRELLRQAAAIGDAGITEGSMTSDELYALIDAVAEAEAWSDVNKYDPENEW